MAHHHLGLSSYADYFAAGGGRRDAGDGDHHHIYGVHQPGGAEAAFVPAEMAHGSKAALDFGDLSGHAHHGQPGHHLHATMTSLSLHGLAAEAASSLAAHQHQQQLGGGAHRHQAWPQQQQGAWHLRGSRFLLPTQQLLKEFCSLPVETTSPKPPPKNPGNEEDGSSSSAPSSARIQAMDSAELQRLKAKLYAMLDEVDRRYRRYCEQMRAVSGSFEAVAGARAAAAYTRLASRTISRHFRALRDGVAAQVEAVRRALGEKDAAAGGGVPRARVETMPRLRVLDQCLRQRRAYQAGVLESQPWRPQRGLPERAVSILRAWLFEHFLHPYPSDVDKHILARQTGLSRSQVSNWFINARVRLWKPMVEEMYTDEVKNDPEEEGDCSNTNTGNGPNPGGEGRGGASNDDGGGERKPTRAQLQVVHDAGSLASVVSIGSSRDHQQQNLSFGLMGHNLDFGPYDDHATADGQGFSGGVSLTLGLQQQHADPYGGVNVAFAAAPSSSAYEFSFMDGGGAHQMDDGGGMFSGGQHGHQFGVSMAEGDTGVAASATNYPDRGLQGATGFQLLRDLAG